MDTNTNELGNSPIAQEIKRKKAKRMKILFWVCLACLPIALAGAIITRVKMDNQNLEGIKEVKVQVVDVKERNIKINGSVNTYYTVKVEYFGKEYKLVDGGHSPWIHEGYNGTAYMYEDRIFAQEDGPATRTGVGTLYYVFLISTIALFIITPCAGASLLDH